MIQNAATIVYVIVSLVGIGILIYLYMQCKSKCPNEGLCLCQNSGNRYCVNRDEVQKLYTEGKRTESSELVRGPNTDPNADITQFHQYPNSVRTQCS
jgi:hypothetical protein